jgi:hypothetical protein
LEDEATLENPAEFNVPKVFFSEKEPLVEL